MDTPRNIISHASIWLVSLICIPLAALLLMMPLHRLLVPMWPVTIEEYRLSDGSTALRQAGNSDLNEGLLRSRPLSAAVLDVAGNGQPPLGYVIALRTERPVDSEIESTGEQIAALPLPDQPFWQPRDVTHPDQPCKLALSQPGEAPIWLNCDSVRRVVFPNQLTLKQKLEVAIARLADFSPSQPTANERAFNAPEILLQEDLPAADEPQSAQ